MKLFIGLGNPGDKYAGNRHNIGFMAVDRIADSHGFGPWRSKFQGAVAEGNIGGERVVLLKPTTYMNESGRSAGEAARFLKIEPDAVYAFHDELDLAPAKVKVKTGGGNAGHNGLKSLSAHLGNDYVRVRLGIGHPGSKDAVVPYVLNDFAKIERTGWLPELLDAVAKASPHLARADSVRFLSEIALLMASSGGEEDTEPQKPKPVNAEQKPDKSASQKPRKLHGDGERGAKRQSALAENLKKWLQGRTPKT